MKRLTGNIETDYLVMYNLSDKDLGHFCQTDSYTRKLCKNDIFWMNRTLKKFSSLGEELMKNIKDKYFESWRDYYIDLVNFLEYIYLDKVYLQIYEGEVVNFLDKYFVPLFRKDLFHLHDMSEKQTQLLEDLKNLKQNLKQNFANPNIFFFENSLLYAEDADLKNILEIVKYDDRFKSELALFDIFYRGEHLSKNIIREMIESIYDFFTVQNLLNVLKKKYEEIPDLTFYLEMLRKKGATKEDFTQLLNIKIEDKKTEEDDGYEEQKNALNKIKKFIKKYFKNN